ncbi:hypothetical protein D9623_28155 (plasmid) [Azospirillum brasilense]|nr:hypothetical protein D9623_28155 [Azospirillum brasilense]
MARRAGEGDARGGTSGKSATPWGGGGGMRVAGRPAKAQPPHPNPLPRGERGQPKRLPSRPTKAPSTSRRAVLR